MKQTGNARLSKEEFKKLYDQNSGFLPSISENHPVLKNEGKTFFESLEEGCDLLIKHRPDLVNYSLEDDSTTI